MTKSDVAHLSARLRRMEELVGIPVHISRTTRAQMRLDVCRECSWRGRFLCYNVCGDGLFPLRLTAMRDEACCPRGLWDEEA